MYVLEGAVLAVQQIIGGAVDCVVPGASAVISIVCPGGVVMVPLSTYVPYGCNLKMVFDNVPALIAAVTASFSVPSLLVDQ
jgi:hypothetical protein